MDSFIARQPIFNRKTEVVAYELLFRNSLENYFSHPDPNAASSKVIADSFLLLDLDGLTGGKKAFINVTGEVLLREYALLLPRDRAVIEILETVRPDGNVVAACRKLKGAGYEIALDDFVDDPDYEPLVALADIIKVDFIESESAQWRTFADRFAPRGIRMLAEKIETRAVFDRAMDMGYSYFQGFFFSRPVIVQSRDISPNRLQYMRFLKEIHEPDLDFGKLESAVRQDVSLSYKLLRYINSPFFGVPGEIHSIQQALLLLGEKEVKKWATLMALSAMAEDKPAELIRQGLVRALLLESLAERTGRRGDKPDFFLMGLLSVIDAIMDRPLDEILSQLPLPEALCDGLLGRPNPYHDSFEVVLSYEKGQWERFGTYCQRVGISEKEIPELYVEAIRSAGESLTGPGG